MWLRRCWDGGLGASALVEVVWEGFLGGLFSFPTVEIHGELGLGRSPGGMDQRGPGGLPHLSQDLGDGLGIGEECDEREGFLAGRADKGDSSRRPWLGFQPTRWSHRASGGWVIS